MKVRTRFAPSPTGLMHIGGVRTALYAYLVAKKNDGVFSLRIEDTDRNRFMEGATEDIIESLKWLGLEFEQLVIQSDRKKLYQDYAKQLIENGSAYEKDGAIWFKMPLEGKLEFRDLIGDRRIEFDLKVQKDFVLLKSDGFPTYHLAHVVDDHLMETDPVIRAEEWLSSIPKHLVTFKAFGWDTPQYAHLPLILGSDRSKLSKRHGAKGVSEFRQDGFLPEAIINYMAFLGWTPSSGKEFLNLSEMVAEFDLEGVHVSPAVFDVTKLEWMNGEYIRRMSDEQLAKRIEEYLELISEGQIHPAVSKLEEIVPLIKERIKKLSDFVPLTNFLFEKPEYEKQVFERVVKEKPVKELLKKVKETLNLLNSPWQSQEFEQTFKKFAQDNNLSTTETFQLIRVAISGQTVTPPLFESIQILGEEETKKRVDLALSVL